MRACVRVCVRAYVRTGVRVYNAMLVRAPPNSGLVRAATAPAPAGRGAGATLPRVDGRAVM